MDLYRKRNPDKFPDEFTDVTTDTDSDLYQNKVWQIKQILFQFYR